MSPQTKHLLGFVFFSFLYTLNSYFLLTRDAFLLERVSLALNQPWIQSFGLKFAQLIHANSLPTAILAISFIGLFYFYLKLIKTNPLTSTSHRLLFSLAIIFFLVSFPVLSTDIFDNNNFNRLRFIHHLNPLITPANQVPSDGLIYMGSWIDRPSVYPVLSHFFFALVFLIFGGDLIPSILGFKLLNLVFYIVTALLLANWPQKINSPVNPVGLFLFNPLILIEFIGNAHNDIYLAFFALLSLYFLTKKTYSLAGLSLGLSVLSKISSLIYAPVIGLYLLTISFSSAFKFGLTFSVSLIAGFALLGSALSVFLDNLNRQTQTYLRSLPTLARFAYKQALGNDIQAIQLQKLTTNSIFVIAFLAILSKLKRISLPASLVLTMSAYLILTSPMIQPWYLIWFLPFASLLTSKKLLTSTIIFCFSSLSHYLVLYASFYFHPLNFTWQIIMYLAIILPPLAVFFLPQKWYTLLQQRFIT